MEYRRQTLFDEEDPLMESWEHPNHRSLFSILCGEFTNLICRCRRWKAVHVE